MNSGWVWRCQRCSNENALEDAQAEYCLGRLGSSTATPITVGDFNSGSLPSKASDSFRIAWLPPSLDFDAFPCGSDLLVKTKHDVLDEGALKSLSEQASKMNYNIAVSQVGSIFNTSSSSIFFHENKSGKYHYSAPNVSSLGGSLGSVGIIDLMDINKGELHMQHFGFKFLKLIVCPKLVLPEYTSVKPGMEFLSVGGQEVFNPNAKQAKNARIILENKRIKDLRDAVKKAMSTKTPTIIQLCGDPHDELEVLSSLNLGLDNWPMANYGDFTLIFSPVFAMWRRCVLLSEEGGILMDIDSTMMRNFCGVFCPINGSMFGFGSNGRLIGECPHERNRNTITRFGRLRSEDLEFLQVPSCIQTHCPETPSEVDNCVFAANTSLGEIHLDLEWGPNTRMLGTVALLVCCPRPTAILFRKQVIGDESFAKVVALLRKVLLIDRRIAVVFDVREDKKVLLKNNVFTEDELYRIRVIDLKVDLQCVFPEVYIESKGTTALGLRNFVMMSTGMDLQKDFQKTPGWDTEQIQRSEDHIKYALLDVIATYLICKNEIDRENARRLGLINSYRY